MNKGTCILQPHHILDALDEVQSSGGRALAEGPFLDVLRSAQEAIVVPPFVAIAVRPRPGVWEYVRVNVHELSVEQLTVPEYLRFKEALVDGQYVLLRHPLILYPLLCFVFFAGICGGRLSLFSRHTVVGHSRLH